MLGILPVLLATVNASQPDTDILFEVNSGALQQSAHQLVRIPSDRVAALDAVQLRAMLRRQQAASTPSGLIEVQIECQLGRHGRRASWTTHVFP